jgi:LSD1 subclass zinc finger protein
MNLNNLKYKLMAFMQSRYGPDPMYKGLFAVAMVLIILNLFVRSSVLYFLAMGLIVYSMFRFFSKDRARRAAENQRYLALRDKTKKRLLLIKNRIRDIRTHRYRSCPSCKTTLRLKKQVGTTHVKCPVCRNEFEVEIKR